MLHSEVTKLLGLKNKITGQFDMANHYDEQEDEQEDVVDQQDEVTPEGIPTTGGISTTGTLPIPDYQIGPIPIPGAPAGSVQAGPTSYYTPLSPRARMVIGQEIPRSEWLRQPVETQIPWSVLEYDRRKKEWESQQRMESLVQSLSRTPMASASKAIEMATQMEGRLAFDSDVQAGMPIPEALMKHATKMYAGQPSAQLGALKMSQPQTPFVPQAPTQVAPGLMRVQRGPNAYAYMPVPQAGPTGPIEATPIIDAITKEKIASMVPGTKKVLTEKAMEGLSPAQKADVLSSMLRSTLSQIESGKKFLWPKETMDKLETDATSFRNQLNQLLEEASKPKSRRDKYNPETKKFEPVK